MGGTEDERTVLAVRLFETFLQASSCRGTLQAFASLCRQLDLDPLDHSHFYHQLKDAVRSWKVQALWTRLDQRAQHPVYGKNQVCSGTRCLVVGAGPCGLRTAIELSLLGCRVVVMEKRDCFSRNNVLHLWPFTIHDLRGLGAKKFYGKFCAGSIDHISIRQLQLMLLKISLILGVEVHVNVEFVKLLEPQDGAGWRAEVRPSTHSLSDFEFDVVIGADGRKNTLEGFTRKEFRGKLAIAITANFVNRNSTAEAKVEEISGVAFIFNQKFFLDLREETGIDLENIVYYRDHTHYFVMTAKKHSLLDKGVLIKDLAETERLLSPGNVNQEALQSFAREAADFGTDYQLPALDFAINHYGHPDVAMFDFTCTYAAENAALIRQKRGQPLLVALVGDSLLEPFWPMGTGCARGFLAAFDTAWMVKRWTLGRNPLEALAERESIYRLLPQTTSENISKNFDQYSIDPVTRYPNLNSSCVRPHQVRHLFIDGSTDLNPTVPTRGSVSLSRRDSEVRPGRLLAWCQNQTEGYRGVRVRDLSTSWKSGLALCALIHRHRPQLIDFDSLKIDDAAANNQLAFDVAEREFGIQPVASGHQVGEGPGPDRLLMILYLTRFYQAFSASKEADEISEDVSSGLEHQIRKRIPLDEKKLEDDSLKKRRRKGNNYLSELSCHGSPPAGENRVRSISTQLLAKFQENSTGSELPGSGDLEPSRRIVQKSVVGAPSYAKERTIGKVSSSIDAKAQLLAILYETDHRPNGTPCVARADSKRGLGGSDICHLCSQRVYVMERVSADGFFFHRQCFRCCVCGRSLRPGGHAFDSRHAKFSCQTHSTQLLSLCERNSLRSTHEDQSSVPSSSSDAIQPEESTRRLEGAEPTCRVGPEEAKPVRCGGPERVEPVRCSGPDGAEPAEDTVRTSCRRGAAQDKRGSQDKLSKQNHQNKQSHRWKRRIRAAFPLFMKNVPENLPDSDFEEIPAPEHRQTNFEGFSRTSAEIQNPPESAGSPSGSTASPKRRLMISTSQKKKLLNWEETCSIDREEEQIAADVEKPGTKGDLLQNQAKPTPTSTLQVIANAFRRRFSTSSRSRPDPPPSQQSGGGSSLHPLLCPPGSSRDLPPRSQDDLALHPRRRPDLFSSLRLKKKEAPGGAQEEIRSILRNLRNKASSQTLEDSSSSDEDQTLTLHPDKAKKQQEKLEEQQRKREQLKRLHRAQVIQRQLEEVEEKHKELEERGVLLEKTIRGETDAPPADDSEEEQLYQSWFKLVQEKNRLASYESELIVFAQELELEETQSRLEQELRRRMAQEDTLKSSRELQEEQQILQNLMRTVENRDQLVSLLEEQRLQERQQDQDLEGLVLSRGYRFHWEGPNDT